MARERAASTCDMPQLNQCVGMQTVTLTHYAKQKADYKCSLAEQRITGLECKPATLSAPPAPAEGLPLSVDIVYEPTALTDTVSDVITIVSPVGGTYEVPVTAR